MLFRVGQTPQCSLVPAIVILDFLDKYFVSFVSVTTRVVSICIKVLLYIYIDLKNVP